MILEKFKCRLIRMNEIDFGNEYPFCDKNETIIESWLNEMRFLEANDCKIIPRCTMSMYETSYEPTLKKTGVDRSFISIQLASSYVQSIKDSYSYDLQSFVGEVGGTMGLLLGLSFLSVFDLFDLLLKKILKL